MRKFALLVVSLLALCRASSAAEIPIRILPTLDGNPYPYDEAYFVASDGTLGGVSGTDVVIWPPGGGVLRVSTGTGQSNFISDMNDSLEIAGSFSEGAASKAFFWSPQKGYLYLGDEIGGEQNGFIDLNNRGQAVAASWNHSRAYFWSLETGVLPMTPEEGGSNCWPFGLNDSGTAIISCEHFNPTTNEPTYGSYTWTLSGGLRALPTPTGIIYPNALKINSRGDIAGEGLNTATRLTELLIWKTDGTVKSFGSFSNDYVTVRDFNDRGEVLLQLFINDLEKPVLWSENGGLSVIALEVTQQCVGFDLNNLGEVVGSCAYPWPADQNWRAFYWSKGSGRIDLGALDTGESQAYRISEQGIIVGSSFQRDSGDPTKWANKAVSWSAPRVSDPRAGFAELAAKVKELYESGLIPKMLYQSLSSKVAAAKSAWEGGKEMLSSNILRVFKSEVAGVMKSRKKTLLPEDSGNDLIRMADALQTQISIIQP